MHEVRIKSNQSYSRKFTVVNIPERWDEVPLHFIPFYIHAIAMLPWSDAVVSILRKIIPKKLFRKLTAYQLTDITSLLNWLQLAPSSTPIIQKFTHKGVIYHLPKPSFSNGTAMEYPIADDYYTKALQAQVDDTIDSRSYALLTATLCRPACDPDQALQTGDARIEMYARAEVEARADELVDLPDYIHLVVLLYFAGVKDYIHKIYGSTLFAEPDESSEGGGTLFGWWGIYMDVAEAGIFGNLKQVHQSSFHEICMYLVKKYKDAQARERQAALSNPG